MDLDINIGDLKLKPTIEEVLLLNDPEIYPKDKPKKYYYGKKRYKNSKIVANVEITDAIMEKMIIDDLNGKHFPDYVKYFKSHYKDSLNKSMKNSQKSLEARVKANELLSKTAHSAKVHKDIWELYSKSIAFGPIGSNQLALAYECRSNLLLHLKKYEDCVQDIDRALKITEFHPLKCKLLCRKMSCFVAMDKNTDEKIKLWETINYHFEKINVALKNKEFLEMVEQAKNDSQKQPSETKNEAECSESSAMSTNTISMEFHKELRFVANRDCVPGDMVASVKPNVTSFNPNKFYAYCSHCLSFTWAGIPCDECSLCMYCSENCKTKAWNKYHILECKLLPHINFQNINYNIMHLSSRVLLKGIREYGSISKLRETMMEIDKLRGDSKLERSLYDNDFVLFYTSLYTRINSSEYNLDIVSKMAMKSCFLIACMIQTCDIFEGKNFKSSKGKDLAKNQYIVNFAFVLLKIMISSKRNIKAAGRIYRQGIECDKYGKSNECSRTRHCIIGSYFDTFSAMFEKSCSPNVARCWTDDGNIIYYCVQPIKKLEKITICNSYEFYLVEKDKRDRHNFFSIYCQCIACVKNWPIIDVMFEKYKIRRLKVDIKEEKQIMEKYLENESHSNLYGEQKNGVFDIEEYQQLLRDVNEVVKVCGQPSFPSSLMIDYLCQAFEKRYGNIPLISHIPAEC